MSKGKYLALFILILFLGAALRFLYFSKQWSIWWDETVYMSMAEAYGGNNYFFEPFRPPLLPFTLFLWNSVFDYSLLSSRVFILLLSILSLPLAYVLTKRAMDEDAALLTASLLALNAYSILYSARVLSETHTILFSTLSIASFYTGYRNNSKVWLVVGGVAMAFGMMSKHLAAYLPVSIFLYFLVKRRANTFKDRRFYIVLAAGLIAMSPWLIDNYLSFGNPFWPQLANIGLSPPEGLLFYATLLPQFLGLQGLLIPFAFVGLKKSRHSEFLKLNILAIVVGLLILHAVAHKEDRFLMILTYPVTVLEAVGLMNLANMIDQKRRKGIIKKIFHKSDYGRIIIIVIAALFALSFSTFSSLPRQYEDLFYKCTDEINKLPKEKMSTTMSPYFSYFTKRFFEQLPWEEKDFSCNNLIGSGVNYTVYYSAGWYQPLEKTFIEQTAPCTKLIKNITENQKCLIFKVNR
ncbi:MAG: glycosyltransferase family 39 protein [Candidatus Aenigmarchaeota archaeon]|nr:glycosyltransferase family 39 protein [Candidatus Aenigmarchaeota archaeon]